MIASRCAIANFLRILPWVQVDYTHSSIILEFNTVSITLTLTPLIVIGINFLGVIGNVWMTLTL